MDTPPTFPSWIRDLRAAGYTSPCEILDLPSIYGTEGLCGDWNGEVLVLAKDFAPVEHVRRVAKTHGDVLAWRHNDGDGRYTGGIKTNRQLMVSLFGDARLIDGRAATTCNVVYGSASFFLKPGEGMSSTLSGWREGREVFDGSLKVLNHVVSAMPNLKVVVCLGMDALKLLAVRSDFSAPETLRDAVGKRLAESPSVYVVPHPAARGMAKVMKEAWAFVSADSGLDWIGRRLPDRSL